jgi:hypothetical protein
MCSQIINNIKLELTSRDKLLITTRNNSCAYTIMQAVLQPQLSAGRSRLMNIVAIAKMLLSLFREID